MSLLNAGKAYADQNERLGAENMDKNRIIKMQKPVIRLENVHSMGVIGDPGCEGLGTYNMKVYAGALEESGKDDITQPSATATSSATTA